jgi:hypothetical protein
MGRASGAEDLNTTVRKRDVAAQTDVRRFGAVASTVQIIVYS